MPLHAASGCRPGSRRGPWHGERAVIERAVARARLRVRGCACAVARARLRVRGCVRIDYDCDCERERERERERALGASARGYSTLTACGECEPRFDPVKAYHLA